MEINFPPDAEILVEALKTNPDCRDIQFVTLNFSDANLRFLRDEMAIKIEFGDRYSSASTYHCLGTLAEAEENYAEARVNLQTALEIYVEYKEEYWGAIAREALERLQVHLDGNKPPI
ncbi:hypothetical protein [Nostoc sp.]|uniref:hypothetical protein n=1 Tax=Nostoc sp. TaxID=1180 RepID=UPI002FF97045